MTRFRIRLLITLALFAAVATAGATTTHAGGYRPNTPSYTDGASGVSRPAIRPTTGEPDLPGNSPSRVTSREANPQLGGKAGDHSGHRFEWVQRVWAVWLAYLMR